MAENSRFGREPIQVVQIDQDFCSRTYSELPCRATPFANLLDWSENFDNANLFSYTFTRQGTNIGPDGFVYQVLEIDNDVSPGTGGAAYNSRNYLVLDGRASFTYKFKKTTYSAPLEISIGTEVNSGSGAVFGENTVEVDSQTGLVTNTVDFGYFVGIFTSEDHGDYVTLRLELEAVAIDPDVNETKFSELIRIVSNNGDILEVGKVQAGPSDLTGEYIKTEADFREPTGTQPCFNTRATCQDPENYDKTVLPLKFITDRTPIPVDDYYIPSIKSVRVTPAKLNPGGADRNARALGQRASISVSFQDHPHNDRIVDLYRTERDYTPEDRGTFWTKWRARNPYYMQRPIQLISGYLKDGQIVEPITRDFVITGFSGPDASGNVTISGKDVLTLAEDEKAQAPVASSGKLSADLTAGATSATLTPAGIGNSEYPASGEVRIGKEVMSFTRSGDNLTLTRGQFGTEADEHDEDDTVQLCLRYVSEAPQDILYDLLLNYANIPAVYLDKDQWDAEALDFLPRLYTAIITEPNGVSKLISEMCQQMYFTIWWDERLGKVLLKSVRLAQEDEVFELDDNRHLIADSISWSDLSDELITQVWVYYGQIDPTDKLDQGSNYSTIAITADPSAEGADKHNLRRIKTIFSRWIDATNASAAEDLGRRILDRYGNAPRQVAFRVDAKDDYLWLGDYIRLTNRLRVDQFGLPTPVNLQIFQAEEASLGSEYRFTAQEFIPALQSDQVGDPNERIIPITSDLLNVNLRSLHDSLFGAPAGTETVTFILREGVTIGGYAAGGGVNVPYGQRDTSNDFYSAGNSSITGDPVGLVPLLQRSSISSSRTISQGNNYESIGPADYDVSEVPVSVAVRTGSWPAGVVLKLVVEAGARILGEAGNGSCHVINGYSGSYTTTGLFDSDRPLQSVPGGDGGDSLLVEYDVEITNGGVISGGGGGGASSSFVLTDALGEYKVDFTYGGGAAGLELSDTKQNLTHQTPDPIFFELLSERNASGGSITSGGVGGLQRLRYAGGINIRYIAEKISGRGGGLAQSGGQSVLNRIGDSGRTIPDQTYILGQGGQPGKAIRSGANLVTWVNKGDVRGQEVT